MSLKAFSEIIIVVKVIPKCSRNEIVGWENDELKVRLMAVPEKGAANSALIAFLANKCGVSKSQVRLLSGETSRHKRLAIQLKVPEIPEFLIK